MKDVKRILYGMDIDLYNWVINISHQEGIEESEIINRAVRQVKAEMETIQQNKRIQTLRNNKPFYNKGQFVPPTYEMVEEYMIEIGKGGRLEAELFCDNYAAKGWNMGVKKMYDWKASVRYWCNLSSKFNQHNQPKKSVIEIVEDNMREKYKNDTDMSWFNT